MHIQQLSPLTLCSSCYNCVLGCPTEGLWAHDGTLMRSLAQW